MSSIWLVGGYGVGNLGDDLLGHSVHKAMSEMNDQVRLIAGEYYPFERHVSLSRGSIVRSLRKGDLLLLAGGGLLGETFGLSYTRYFTSLSLAARLRGLHVRLVGVGIEKFHSRQGRLLARALFAAADSVGVRDSSSARIAERLATKTKVHENVDLGWLALDRIRPYRMSVSSTYPTVAVTVAAESPKTGRDRAEILVRTLKQLLKLVPDVKLIGVPMQSSRVDWLDDYGVLANVAGDLPMGRMTVEEPKTYLEAVPILARCSMVFGYRLHALVIGAMLGLPVTAISRSHKVRDALMGYPMGAVYGEDLVNSDTLATRLAMQDEMGDTNEAELWVRDKLAKARVSLAEVIR